MPLLEDYVSEIRLETIVEMGMMEHDAKGPGGSFTSPAVAGKMEIPLETLVEIGMMEHDGKGPGFRLPHLRLRGKCKSGAPRSSWSAFAPTR